MFNFSLTRGLYEPIFERVQKDDRMYIVGCYAAYLLITLTVTVWVAHTLHKNGRVFLVDAFHGNTALADSVNHLLVVGFYLINVVYVAVALKADANLTNLRGAIELVSDKIGVVLLVLGGIHFFNLLVFSRMRQRGRISGLTFSNPSQVSQL
jgi:hypothetical protein